MLVLRTIGHQNNHIKTVKRNLSLKTVSSKKYNLKVDMNNKEYEYLPLSPQNKHTQFMRRLDPEDDSCKDFFFAKRTNKSLREVNRHEQTGRQKRDKKSISSSGRISVLDENLQLTEDNGKLDNSSKFYQMKQMTTTQDEKTKEMKIVAYSLIKKGYGVNFYQQFVEQERLQYLLLSREKYKSYTISVVQKCYRKIETYMRSECQKSISTLRHEEMRLFMRYLLRYNIYFTRANSTTFSKFIYMTYDLQGVTIANNQVIQLYRSIIILLKKIMNNQEIDRVIEEPEERIQQKKQINGKYDDQLIQFYQLNQQYSKIHKCFCSIHPQLASRITPQRIQKRMERILKDALRRLKMAQEQNRDSLSQIVDLNDNRIGFIIRSPTCTTIRLALLDFRENEPFANQQELTNVIMKINQKFGVSSRNNDYLRNEMLQRRQPTMSKSMSSSHNSMKYSDTQDHQESYEESRLTQEDETYKINRFAAQTKSKEINFNRYEEVSDEYSDG